MMFSLAIREMEIKTMVRYHFIPTMIAIRKKMAGVGKGMEKLKLSFTAGENVKCCGSFVKQFGNFSKS